MNFSLLVKVAMKLAEEMPDDEALKSFLIDNPNPPDEKIHEWAKEQGKSKDKVETDAYRLATTAAKLEDQGESNSPEAEDANFKPDQVAKGIEVEKEHTTDPATAEKITKDHLTENEDYYDPYLKNMEEEMNAGEKKAYVLGYMAGICLQK